MHTQDFQRNAKGNLDILRKDLSKLHFFLMRASTSNEAPKKMSLKLVQKAQFFQFALR